MQPEQAEEIGMREALIAMIPDLEERRTYLHGRDDGPMPVDDIPDAILDNEIDHRQPVEGDKGITFEPTEMSTHVEFDYLFA